MVFTEEEKCDISGWLATTTRYNYVVTQINCIMVSGPSLSDSGEKQCGNYITQVVVHDGDDKLCRFRF
jgi:hypothetical protein